MDVSSMTQ